MTRKTKISNSYPTPALEKGLDIIELLTDSPEGLSQADVARQLNRSTSEIFRMLSCLERRGYLYRKKPEELYFITMKLFELAHRYPPTKRLQEAAFPVMRQLRGATGQSCHLGIPHNYGVLIIAQAESLQTWGFSVKIGGLLPLLATASGRILLAFQSTEIIHEWLQHQDENKKKRGVMESLEAIRQKGFDQAPSNLADGVTEISYPITDRTGTAVAALTIPYLPPHGNNVDTSVARQLLARAAQQITESIDGRIGMRREGVLQT